MSVVEVFIHSVEYSKLCNFAYVSPYDSKAIKPCVSVKYTTSIVSWLKILNSRDIPDTDVCVYILLLFYIVSAFRCEINVYINCNRTDATGKILRRNANSYAVNCRIKLDSHIGHCTLSHHSYYGDTGWRKAAKNPDHLYSQSRT